MSADGIGPGVEPHQRMGPGNEFDTIRDLLARWGTLAVGIGDDAALLHAPPGRALVASTDAFVENAHFRNAWLSSFEIGARATAAALSDLAAMGAQADAILIAFVVPEHWRPRLGDVADGIAHVVRAAGARIAGGNISSGSAFSITSTVIGSAARAVPRSGAQPGDVLLVTGQLGGPGRALRDWDNGHEATGWARARFAMPVARLDAGQAFAAGGAHAMLDISDGLAADARHMAAASRVRLMIDPARLPCGPDITPAEAMASGEEYELLVACAPEAAEAFLADIPARFGTSVTRVGEVLAMGEDSGAQAEGSRGVSRVELVPGHDHFSR